jgi:hypothetical protein
VHSDVKVIFTVRQQTTNNKGGEMTVSSTDIHDVTSISVDKTRELDGFSPVVASRHIRIISADSQGGIHHHTITVYGDKAGDLEITFNQQKKEKK